MGPHMNVNFFSLIILIHVASKKHQYQFSSISYTRLFSLICPAVTSFPIVSSRLGRHWYVTNVSFLTSLFQCFIYLYIKKKEHL